MNKKFITVLITVTILFFGSAALADSMAPLITPIFPLAGITSNPQPIVAALITDMPPIINSGISKSSATLKFDGTDVTGFKVEDYLPGQYLMFWQPPSPTNGGAHTITITIADKDGNVAIKTWNYTSIYPQIQSTNPLDGQAIGNAAPPIVATFAGGAPGYTVYTTAAMKIDGNSVTPAYDKNNVKVSYQVPAGSPLADGRHTVHVEISYYVETGISFIDWLISHFESFFKMNVTLAQYDWTFITDTGAPVAALNTPVAGAMLKTRTISITGSVKEIPPPGSGISQPIDLKVGTIPAAVAYDESTGNFTAEVTVPADGDYTITLNARDMLGHQAAPVTRTIHVDATPPILIITSPIDGARVGTPGITVTGTTEPGAGVKINGNPAAVQGNGAFTGAVALANGANTITVEAKDAVGNTVTDTRSVFLDRDGPAISITTPADNEMFIISTVVISADYSDDSGVNSDSAAVELNGNPANDGCAITPGFLNCTKTLANGAYTLKITAADTFGNSSSRTLSFKVDTNAPALTITAPANGFKTKDNRVTVSGATSGVSVKVNGVSVPVSGGAFTTTVALQEGINIISVEATGGNGLTSLKTVSTMLDTIPPTIVIAVPPEGFESPVAQVQLQASLSDAGAGINSSGITVLLNGVDKTQQANVTANSANLPLTLEEGSYTARITAADVLGNSAFSEVHFSVRIAVVPPPALTITAPANNSVTKSAAVLVTGVTDVGATIKVNDSAATVHSDGNFSKTVNVAEGLNVITVAATGRTGLQTIKTVAVTRDTIAPVITITSPSEGIEFPVGNVAFSAVISDTGLGVDRTKTVVTVDGEDRTSEANVTESSAQMSLALSNGAHNIAVSASDNLGNAAQARVNFSINVSGPAVPPHLSITYPTSGMKTNTAELTVTGATDAGVTLTINGNPASVGANGAFSAQVTLSEGGNVITVLAVNGSGLSTVKSVAVTLDTIAPRITIQSPQDGETLVTGAAVFLAIFTDEGAGVDPAKTILTLDGDDKTSLSSVTPNSITLNLTALSNGRHTFVLRVGDKVGNGAQAQVHVTVNVPVIQDNAAPELVSIIPADGAFVPTYLERIEAVLRDPPGGTGINRESLAITLDGSDLGLHFDESTGKLIADVKREMEFGPHQILIQAADRAGNVMVPVLSKFTVDTDVNGIKPDFIYTSNFLGTLDLYGFYSIGGLGGGLSSLFDPGDPLAALANAVDSLGIPVRITDASVYNGMPSYSKDADFLVFTSARDGNSEIYRVTDLLYRRVKTGIGDGPPRFEFKRGREKRLTDGASYDSQPFISRDGSRIAFVSNRNGNFDVFTMKSDGTDVRQITNDPAIDDSPAISPDGTRIAFVSNRDGRFAIYEAPAAGGSAVKIISGEYQNISPQYSADETKILFSANPDGWFDLYEYEISGGRTKRLTNNKAREIAPVYSPRTGAVLFSMKRGGQYDIFTLDGVDAKPVVFPSSDDLTR